MDDYPADDMLIKGAIEVVERHVVAANTDNQEAFESTIMYSALAPKKRRDAHWETTRAACPITLSSIKVYKISVERTARVSGVLHRSISVTLSGSTKEGPFEFDISVWCVRPTMEFYFGTREFWEYEGIKVEDARGH